MPNDNFDLSSLPWTDQSNLIIPKKKRKKRRAAVPKAPRQEREPSTMTVSLQFPHSVNGHSYGPGTVTVSPALARSLKEADGRAAISEGNFWGTKACIIGPRTAQGTHRVTQVPPETFESSVENATPVERTSGRGMVDPGLGNMVQF